MTILAIETSCDETACAVVADGEVILSNAVASSSEIHKTWGGIVPELAAREQLSYMMPVLTEAVKPLATRKGEPFLDTVSRKIDTIAVTVGPGLNGSLIIGTETAKILAYATGKPLIPVNHVQAHMYANFVRSGDGNDGRQVEFPAISLVASGGHTELFLLRSERDLEWLGGTIDDAAGEAFDKTARLLGLGSGGGRAVEEAAGAHDDTHTPPNLPRPLLRDGTLNFSFSGLKTAVMREWKKLKSPARQDIAAFASGIQEAISDVLVEKTMTAVSRTHARTILLSGGVAANKRLRDRFRERATRAAPPVLFHAPPVTLCTDNAVFIASYAYFRGRPEDWRKIRSVPDLTVEA